jgi:hypothetical protein
MWFLGKRETVNAWKKADFDGFRDGIIIKFIKYEKRLRKEGNMLGLPINNN